MRSLSWRLYRVLNSFNDHPVTRHAVYWYAQRRLPRGRFYEPGPWINSVIAMVITTSTCGLVMAFINRSPTLFMTPIFCLGPLAVMLVLPLLWIPVFSFALVSRIIRERTQGTWDLLRITPLDDATLLLAHIRSTFSSNLLLMYYLRAALVLAGLMVGLGFVDIVLFSPNVWHVELSGYVLNPAIPGRFIFPLGLALCTVGFVLFLADRIQQLLYTLMVGLAAGTKLRDYPHLAAIFGAATACGAWLVECVGALFIMRILATDPNVLSIGFWIVVLVGPIPGLMLLAMSPWRMLFAFGIMFGAREVALRGLWHWVLRAAQQE